ncbi:MAG: hypothetical protein KGI28_03630 [Thaumarchaeota archaeon]|nr:hypothetical protein [Nitrososphaerota archaeon]
MSKGFQMNINKLIQNKKLFLVIFSVLTFSTIGLSTAYADSDDNQMQALQNQLPVQNTISPVQYHIHNHFRLHHGAILQNPSSGGTPLNNQGPTQSQIKPQTNSAIIAQNAVSNRNSINLQSNTGPNATTSSMTTYDNSVLSGVSTNIAHAETESEANGENGITANNPASSEVAYNGNNQNTMNPAKLDLVLWITIFAITSIIVHSAWKVYKTRRKFAVKKTV